MSWIITGKEAGSPGLLDQYGGAAAAYSLRSLSIYYAGPVVRVRRSSDNTEQDFTATQITDGTLTTFCGAGDGFVQTWYDQSGNGRNATQGTTANQPQIYSNGALILENGKPCLSFDGTTDKLLTQSPGSDLFTVFCVARARSTSNNGRIFGFGQERSVGAFGSGSTWGFYRSSSNITSLTGSLWGSRTLISLLLNFSGGSTFAGNSQPGISFTPFTPIATVLTNLGIGCNGTSTPFEEGDAIVQELIHYSSNMFANRAAIEADINAHYGIF